MSVSTEESVWWYQVCDALIDPSPEHYDTLALLTEQGVEIAAVALAWHDTPRAVALVENTGTFPELRARLALFEEARAFLGTSAEEQQAYEALGGLLPTDSTAYKHRIFVMTLAHALRDEPDCPVVPCYQGIEIHEYSLLRVWRYRPDEFPDSLLQQELYHSEYIVDTGIYLLASLLPENFNALHRLLQRQTGYWFQSPVALIAAERVLDRLEPLELEQKQALLYLLCDCLGRSKTWEDYAITAQILGVATQQGVNTLPMLATLGEKVMQQPSKAARWWARRVLRAVPAQAHTEAVYLRILVLEGRFNQATKVRRWRWRRRAERLIRCIENPLLRRSLELRQSASLK